MVLVLRVLLIKELRLFFRRRVKCSVDSLPDICRYNLFMPDLYGVSAKYYDEAYATLEDLRDLQFYLEMTRRTGGPVLELRMRDITYLLGSRITWLPLFEIGCATHRAILTSCRTGLQAMPESRSKYSLLAKKGEWRSRKPSCITPM
jgi:hypothetical protein